MNLHEGLGLDGVHALTERQATNALFQCCSSCLWARRVEVGRPYPSLAALLERSDAVLAELSEAEVDEALAGHPRIGERTTSASSRREQAGVVDAEPAVLAALAAGNAEYEARFGHVYLVHADGRPAAELLDVLRERLRHDPATERAVVRRELAAITRSRLTRLVEPVDWEAAAWAD